MKGVTHPSHCPCFVCKIELVAQNYQEAAERNEEGAKHYHYPRGMDPLEAFKQEEELWCLVGARGLRSSVYGLG